MTKTIALLTAGLAIALFATGPASAREYPWCAYYGPGGFDATNCGFSTLAQCQAKISGIGGQCQPNPAYRGRVTEGKSRKSVDRNRD